MIFFACVLVGDGYQPEYLHKLLRGIRRGTTTEHAVRVVVDKKNQHHVPQGVGTILDDLLPERTPATTKNYWWWAKLNIFRDGAFPRGVKVVYFDLDTVIRGSIDPLIGLPDFSMLQMNIKNAHFQSGVMVFDAGAHAYIYEEFVWDARMSYPGCGDQGYIAHKLEEKGVAIHAIPSTLVRSYKGHAENGAPVVAFHGRPRPHEARDSIVKDNWI